MKTSRYSRIAGAVMFFALGCSAYAQDAEVQPAGSRGTASGHSKSSFLQDYDANGDGKVTDAEFKAGREAKYKAFDLDGDGKVSVAEYVEEYRERLDAELEKRRTAQIRQTFVRYGVLDTDHDQNMSIDEFHGSGSRMFKRLDTNGDGVIDEKDTSDHY